MPICRYVCKASLVIAVSFLTVSSISAQNSKTTSNVAAQETLSVCDSGMIEFYISDPQIRNTATFNSTAPLEDIVGTTKAISGRLCFNPQNPQAGGGGYIEIPVASLETGIPLRDEHVKSKDWLNAEEYPNILFQITDVKDVVETRSGEGTASYDVVVVGDFSVHGKSKKLVVPARISYLKESEQTRQRLPGDLLAARAEFKIVLADFDIRGPSGQKIIGKKVGKQISIEISLVATSVNPSILGSP